MVKEPNKISNISGNITWPPKEKSDMPIQLGILAKSITLVSVFKCDVVKNFINTRITKSPIEQSPPRLINDNLLMF